MQQGQEFDREHLAHLFWGDRTDASARQNLRQSKLVLQSILDRFEPDPFIGSFHSLGLKPGWIAVDALELITLENSSEDQSYDRVLDLYSGEFLANIRLISDGLDHWIQQYRTRCFEIATALMEKALQHYRAAGEGEKAIRFATRLVEMDSLREDWQRALLLLLVEFRGYDSALSRARVLTNSFKKEFDQRLDPETLEIIEAIKRKSLGPHFR